ncbi:hypothetical protein QT06_C0001G1062 [archaeon GW2011_AR15]|nr:hypothetical protein QT06_C0001G1062 [archaeon GW2011_AR15]
MAMREPHPQRHYSGPRTSHFELPAQFILGFLFLATGALLLLKKLGNDLIPFIPESVLIYICAGGSVLGGIYLIFHKLYRPRLYL